MYLRKTLLLFSETPELRLYLIIFARADQLCIIASNSANKIVTTDIFFLYILYSLLNFKFIFCLLWFSKGLRLIYLNQILRFYNARRSLSQLLQDRSALIQVLPHVGAHVFQTKTCATNLPFAKYRMFPTLPLFSAENEKAKERVETPQSRRWAEGGSTLPLMKFWCILCIQLYIHKNNGFIWITLFFSSNLISQNWKTRFVRL